jgi:glyoxylase I family protein
MALINSTGFAHVRLTVTDINRSKAFYDQSAGDPGVANSPEKIYGGTVYQTPQGALFGLRPVGTAEFDSQRTGLDHISFAVASRADLERAAEALTKNDIKHGEVKDLTDAGIAILSFQDPDDINVELTAPLD